MNKYAFSFKLLTDLDCSEELTRYFNNNPYPGVLTKYISVVETLNQLPKIKEWMLSNKIYPARVSYATVLPKMNTAIHIDSGDSELAINFPLYNTQTIETHFYDCNDSLKEEKYTSTGLRYFSYPEDKCTYRTHYIMKSPVILNLKVPHAVLNTSDDIRHVLSFRFRKDPWHLVNNVIDLNNTNS